MVPERLGDIDPHLLVPSKIWDDENEYHQIAKDLVAKFQNNFDQYDLGDSQIRDAGPSF